MTSLTEEQRRFLGWHGIPESKLFDAQGMKPRRYRPIMEIEERLLVFGVTPCARGKHTIRTRAGHCIQCNTANIAFMQRYYQEAYVYIAGSLREAVTKIGTSQAPWEREAILNKLGYGGITDWKVLYFGRFADAGKVEFTVHRNLSHHCESRSRSQSDRHSRLRSPRDVGGH
jgi:hypothetical protein